MADLQFTVDYKQLKEANREISKVGSNAQKSASVFEAAFKRAEAQSVKSARAVRDQITFSQRMERQKVREANAVAAAATKVANEEERLRRKYVEGYAAMDLYSKELNDLAVARKADIISAEEQRQAVERLNKQMAAGTGVFSGYGAAQQAATKSSSQMGVVTQQAGYQIGDFLVQIQSGTNPMVAFGQQATQLVGILPLMAGSLGMTTAAAIGLSTALGIGIPLLTAIGAYFMRAGEASKKSANDIQGAFKALPDFFEGLSVSISDPFIKAFNEVEVRYGAMFARLAEIKLRETKEALAASFTSNVTEQNAMSFVDRLGAALAPGMVQGSTEASERVRRENAQLLEQNRLIRSIEADYLKGVDAAQSRQDLIDLTTRTEARLVSVSQEAADSFTKQAEELGIISSMSEDSAATQEKNSNAAAATATYYAQMYAQLNETQIAGQKLAEEMYQAFLNGEKLHEIDLEGGVNAAALAAGRLSQELGISLASAAEMVRLQQTKVYGGRGQGPQGVISGQFQPDDALYKKYLDSLREANKKGPTSETGQEALDKLVREAENRRRLVDLTEDQARYEELLFKMQETNASKRDPLSQKELEAAAKKIYLIEEQTRVLEEQNRVQEALASTVESSMENAFMSIIDGTKSAKDAFKSMASDIIKELYRVLVVKRLVATVTGALGFADGGAFSGGSEVKAYANGGVVGGPTYFPMSGGKTGLMGEAGPEAIMPLKRGANGKLGVQMEGGGGDTIVVNQSFNFQANGDDSVKRIIAQAAPQIAQMTKKSIIDDRRRGGQMKATFG